MNTVADTSTLIADLKAVIGRLEDIDALPAAAHAQMALDALQSQIAESNFRSIPDQAERDVPSHP